MCIHKEEKKNSDNSITVNLHIRSNLTNILTNWFLLALVYSTGLFHSLSLVVSLKAVGVEGHVAGLTPIEAPLLLVQLVHAVVAYALDLCSDHTVDGAVIKPDGLSGPN